MWNLQGRAPADARLSALETGFLFLGGDGQPLLVGSLLVLAGPPPAHEQLRTALAEAVRDSPPLRRRIRRWPHDLRRPQWVEDDDFDLGRHLQHLQVSDGDDHTLRRLVPDLMASPLDDGHPPWQVWHVDGLPDQRWALVVRAHHSLVDGVSGTDLLLSLLRQPGVGPPPPEARSTTARPARPRAGLRRLRVGIGAVVHPDLPACAFSGPLGPARSWGWVSRDLGDLERAAQAQRCTVNDVILAALSGAYRDFLIGRGDGVRGVEGVQIRAIVPVSQRRVDPGRVGTVASAMFVDLPIDRSDPVDRLTCVRSRTEAQKSRAVADGTKSVVDLGDRIPTVVLACAARAYARHGQRRVNLAVSNVRGPGEPSELLGRSLLEMIPFIPLALCVRSTVAVVSQGGRLVMGITGDAESLPDFDALLAAVASALDGLIGLQ